ncbi:hypothetical protein Fcan01_24648 [Folsomia candida]|uniref:Uncharacterized protein n=1 Tax=Folsomia candida TaxID=158441 RepID=A0A226D6Q1_FOLCA|nr:hypothetical protein Fcan01_24648 [Folsomia candida]
MNKILIFVLFSAILVQALAQDSSKYTQDAACTGKSGLNILTCKKCKAQETTSRRCIPYGAWLDVAYFLHFLPVSCTSHFLHFLLRSARNVCTDAAACTAAGKMLHGSGSSAPTSDCPSTPATVQCCF